MHLIGHGFFQFMIVRGEAFYQFVDRVRNPLGGSGALAAKFFKVFFGADTGLSHFREEDLAVRHAAQAVGQAEFRERPDGPLRRIPLPGLHTIAVVVLELVVIVVIALAEADE